MITTAGEPSLAGMPNYVEQPANASVQNDWQQVEDAAAVASLLAAAALLLEAHSRGASSSRDSSVAQAEGPVEAADNRSQPALLHHLRHHLQLASRFLLAPWHLQDQVDCPSSLLHDISSRAA